ncbi:hypothetical protein [Mesorhizobium sp.]|uniref:hypothetical protein n=1 Tax=Mesorhizobium sp. TaxID=1871066 RepID=UPI00257C1AFB|nr:hypothetical protein [Mesorhizobium sp.]
MPQKRFQQHEHAVDATAAFAIARPGAAFRFDQTSGAIAHVGRIPKKINSALVSRRLKDVKAQSSIPFVRYTDTLSEISDNNGPGADSSDEKTGGFRMRQPEGFLVPIPHVRHNLRREQS